MRMGLLASVLAAAALAGAVPAAWAATSDMTVEVSGLHSYKGRVVIELWPESSESPKFPDATRVQFRDERPGDPPCDFPNAAICHREVDSLQNLTVTYTFKALPAGDYAVLAFHDENNNGILDTGLMKRPLEARGYSGVLPDDINPVSDNIKFEQARFTLSGPKTITIGLRYPPRF